MILDLLGTGGMGLVFSAFDPQLDRRVAVKILKAGIGSTIERQRLLREAKAMAKLTHPNVVGVYDAGEEAGQTYVAMEFVKGSSLRRWLTDTHTWEEVISLFLQAGRGLQAAHDVGLIHRDFKPDNVLINDAGLAKVADFGLARAENAIIPDTVAFAEADTVAITRDVLTRDGVLLGTPAYMSPEQYLGSQADPRSDQFSFFVALHEALYGELPFGGKTIPELALNVTSGRRSPRSRDTTVPRWVGEIIDRGLRPRPEERWPTMAEALEALDAAVKFDPGRSRRRLLAGIFTALAVVGAALMYRWSIVTNDERQELCSNASSRMIGVWDSDRRIKVREAFTSTGRPYAQDALEHISTRLDEYSAAWVRMHTDACLATHVYGDQSPHLLDLRMACLQRRLTEMRVMVDVFSDADPDVVEQAAGAVSTLKDLHPCADSTELLASTDSSKTPGQALMRDFMREQLAKVRVLHATARYQAGLELANTIWTQAQALTDRSLLAEIRGMQGTLLTDLGDPLAEDVLTDAFFLGESVDGATYILADISGKLIHLMNSRFDVEKGGLWARHARALVMRVENAQVSERESLGVDLSLTIGTHHIIAGQLEQGEENYRRALILVRELPGDNSISLAGVLNNLGNLLARRGLLDVATVELERAAALYRETLGPHHPTYGAALNNLGELALRRRDSGAALSILTDAKSILVAALGPEHPNVGIVITNLGEVALQQGDSDLAALYFANAIEIFGARVGKDSPPLAFPLTGLGESLLLKGAMEEARDRLEQALVLREQQDSPERARTQFALARVLVLNPENQERALKLASDAKETFKNAGPAYTSSLDAVDSWLHSTVSGEGQPSTKAR